MRKDYALNILLGHCDADLKWSLVTRIRQLIVNKQKSYSMI